MHNSNNNTCYHTNDVMLQYCAKRPDSYYRLCLFLPVFSTFARDCFRVVCAAVFVCCFYIVCCTFRVPVEKRLKCFLYHAFLLFSKK